MRDSQTTIGVQKEIGRRIRSARLAAGLTQEEAAAACGIDHKRWQRLEQGTVNATVGTLVRVAAALQIEIWDLLGSASAPEPAPRKRARRRPT